MRKFLSRQNLGKIETWKLENWKLKPLRPENFGLSPYPIKLEVRDVQDDHDVGDVALIKMEAWKLV